MAEQVPPTFRTFRLHRPVRQVVWTPGFRVTGSDRRQDYTKECRHRGPPLPSIGGSNGGAPDHLGVNFERVVAHGEQAFRELHSPRRCHCTFRPW
jgi:hypothetical protein